MQLEQRVKGFEKECVDHWEGHLKSLRSIIGLILFGVFVLSGAANYVIQQFIILPSFTDLECQEAQKDLQRCVRAVTREVEHLDTLCWDWSCWDDTYDFVESLSNEYVESNLVLSTFTASGLNLIYVIDTDGTVVWGEIYDLETEEPMALADFPKDAFPKGHPLISYEAGDSPLEEVKICGVFMTERGPMLISSRPILTTNHEGPSRGSFMMGRLFSDEILQMLVDQTQVSFEVFPVQDDSLPAVIKEIPNRLTKESPYLIEEEGEGHLLIYTNYSNVKGEPGLLMKAKILREISARGHTTMSYVLSSMSISALVVLILMLLILQRTVVRPITALTEHALSIERTGDLSRRLSMERQDEIGTLGREFDRMLEQLGKTHSDLKREITQRKRTEERLENMNDCFLKFGPSPSENINLLTKSCGEMLGAAWALYNRLDGGLLCSLGQWNTPPGYNPEDKPEGHICFDVIRKGGDEILVVRDLPSTCYAETDPNVIPYNLQTYMGKAVKCGGDWVGALCVAFQEDVIPSEEDKRLLEIAASAVGVEEQRRRAEEQRMKLEARLQQAHKMEAIGTLAGGIAHHFNNVLGIIVGNTELAMDDIPDQSPARDSLEEVRQACLRGRDMVKRILSFGCRTEQERIPVKISSLFKECLNLLRSSIPTTIEIYKNISCESDTVLADPTQMNQVLINLCANAAHAMGDGGGTLEVSLENIELDEDGVIRYHDLCPGKYVRLTVSDTGHGMEPEIVDRIFDPYFTTSEVGHGTGMGLSVVHGIVKSHGGVITADSEPGKGTALRVLLPAIEEAPESNPTPGGPLKPFSEERGGDSLLMVSNP